MDDISKKESSIKLNLTDLIYAVVLGYGFNFFDYFKDNPLFGHVSFQCIQKPKEGKDFIYLEVHVRI